MATRVVAATGAATCVDAERVTERFVTFVGLATVACLTGFAAGADESALVAALVSESVDACEVASLTVGVGAGVAAGACCGVTVAGGESVGTGCTCCASSGVDESARAAAIAGRALVRAYARVFLIMGNNRRVPTRWHNYRLYEE